jgi:putative drug exporter of the RND superfamily
MTIPTTVHKGGAMAVLARWCFRHRFAVLALWILAFVVLAGASSAAAPKYNNSFSVPGSDSAKAADLLHQQFPARSGEQDTIVWQTSAGTVRDAGVAQAMTDALADIATLPSVASVVGPYGAEGAAQISSDGRTAYALVNFTELATSLSVDDINKVIAAARAPGTDTLDVEMTGQATDQANRPQLSTTVVVGLAAAAVVLFIAFGSLLAMVLPLLTAIFGLGCGILLTGLLTHAFSIAELAPNLSTLIGLGVGIDYALFIVTRYRRGLTRGLTPEEAAVTALNTAGRAVIFAGGTVCIALLGMLVLGFSFLNGVAVAAALVVLFTVLSAITLLPALFGVLGTRVLSRRQRRRFAARGPEPVVTTGSWARWAGFVERHPRPLALAAAAVMIILCVPVASMRLGRADDGTLPTTMTSRRGYDLLAAGFGPGFSGPLQLVAELRSQGDRAAFATLTDAVRGSAGVAAVTAAPVPPGASVGVLQVFPASSPDSAATTDLMQRLRAQVIPAAAANTTMSAYVGGATAVFSDFATTLNSKVPLFIGVIIALGFVFLLLAFRSFAVPTVAALMNLLGAGASFGVVVAIFQWGWGLNAMGLGTTAPIESFMPVLMLAILFGLSMDYQVFLVSRMHEEWTHTGDSRRAVRVGQAETGRVITAAAGIMLCVFTAFALGGQRLIAEFGIGLIAAVALDAFIVRTILVPALMHMLGRGNWWLPAALDRRLPQLSVERPDEPLPVLVPDVLIRPPAAVR